MPSFLPSRVAKVENCTSIAPTSLFLIGEGDGRRGEEEAGQSQTIKGEREVATSVRPSVRPSARLSASPTNSVAIENGCAAAAAPFPSASSLASF